MPQLGLSAVNRHRHRVLQLCRAQTPAEERTVLPLSASVGASACRQAAPAAAQVLVDDDVAEVIDLVDDKPGEHLLQVLFKHMLLRLLRSINLVSDGAYMLPSKHRCN